MRHSKIFITGTILFSCAGNSLAAENQPMPLPQSLSSSQIEQKQEISGNVLEINGSRVVLERIGFDPQDPTRREKRTFSIPAGTKITQLKIKTPEQFQKAKTSNLQTSEPINPFQEIPAALKDIAPGAQLKITFIHHSVFKGSEYYLFPDDTGAGGSALGKEKVNKENSSDANNDFTPKAVTIIASPPPLIKQVIPPLSDSIQWTFRGKIVEINNASIEFEPFEFNPFMSSNTLKISITPQTKVVQMIPRDSKIVQREMKEFEKKNKEAQQKTPPDFPSNPSPDIFSKKVASLKSVKKGDAVQLTLEQDKQQENILRAREIQVSDSTQNQPTPIAKHVSFSGRVASITGASLILSAVDVSPGVDKSQKIQLLTTSQTQIVRTSIKDEKSYQREISDYQKGFKRNQKTQTFQTPPSHILENKISLKDIRIGERIRVSASLEENSPEKGILTATKISCSQHNPTVSPTGLNQFISGKISNIKNSKLILETSPLSPAAKTPEFVTVLITAQSKVIQNIPKNPKILQKEFDDYNNNQSPTTVNKPAKTPPNPFQEKIISTNAIKQGDNVTVTVLEEDQNNKTESYTAKEIRVHATIPGPTPINPLLPAPSLPQMTTPSTPQ